MRALIVVSAVQGQLLPYGDITDRFDLRAVPQPASVANRAGSGHP